MSIPVALGSEANARELLLITPYSENLVTVKPTDKPEDSAKEIIDKAFAGNSISISPLSSTVVCANIVEWTIFDLHMASFNCSYQHSLRILLLLATSFTTDNHGHKEPPCARSLASGCATPMPSAFIFKIDVFSYLSQNR